MLLSLMIVCSVAAVLFFMFGAFDELRDLWTHPDHRPSDDDHQFPKSRMR